MQNRLKDKDGKKFYPHTLNGSGLAVGRTLIALLENHQNPDSGINLPDILQTYVDNRIT
tara:strand:- start:423 stop:599 length:177 start_codon:yes stop_codon:yes gene_type:complete